MEALIELLKDGKSRSLEMLAAELGISIGRVKRDIEYLEQMDIIRRIDLSGSQEPECSSCAGCSGCGSSAASCHGCVPEGGFKNMGTIWEVVE